MHNRITRIAVLLMIAFAVLALGGCRRHRAVEINDKRITNQEFYGRLQRLVFQTQGGPRQAGEHVMRQIIQEQLTRQLAEKEGVAPTEAQIARKIRMAKRNAEGNFRRQLAAQGLSEAEWKEQLTTQQAMINVITKGIKIPESQVRKAYQEGLKLKPSPLIRPEQVRVSVILCNTKEKADKAYKMLTEGQEFGTVCMKLSDDPNAKDTQGAMGWLALNDPRLPEAVRPVTQTAFALTPGKFSQPKFIAGGWVIVRADQRRPKMVQKYEDVKLDIEERLKIIEGAKKNDYAKKFAQFIKQSDIRMFSDSYKKLPEIMKKEAATLAAEQAKQLAAAKTAKPTARP